MMADHGIVTWIAIVLLIVCSVHSIVEGDNNTLCYQNVTRSESHHTSYLETYQDCWWFSWWCSTERKTSYHITYRNVTVKEATCCPGHENKSQLCEPQCIPKCINGYCAQPNICKCSYGWAEDLCNKTLLCIIRLNLTEAESSVPTSSDNIGLEPGRPECNPKCSDSSISELMDSGNSTYKFLPIDAQCNTNAAAQWRTSYGSVVGVCVGLVLVMVALIVCVVYIVRWKRTMKDKMQSQSIEYTSTTDFMVNNEIYS